MCIQWLYYIVFYKLLKMIFHMIVASVAQLVPKEIIRRLLSIILYSDMTTLTLSQVLRVPIV